MSGLAGIYAALAAVEVSAAGKTPIVFDHDALPQAVTTAQLPCRLLLPLGQLDGHSAALSLGGGRVARWHLTDLLLWAADGQGRGLGDHSTALVAYCEAYAAAITPGMSLDGATSRATIARVRFEPGRFVYPSEHGSGYRGVACRLVVEEIA